MSRHRNVRSMNFSDEYDGYDDVYGHSVEDDYCISPSDEAQFMYDRTRHPQMSAFFSEQDDIEEEDSDPVNNKCKRDSFIRPKLNDLDEARLRSCLEEIRNVMGDNVSEQVIVETALKYDFDVNKCLDSILTSAAGSSIEVANDAPKPQRVKRERNTDFDNYEDSNSGTDDSTKQISHNELLLEMQDAHLSNVQNKFCSLNLSDKRDTTKFVLNDVDHSSLSEELCSQSCPSEPVSSIESSCHKDNFKDQSNNSIEKVTSINIPTFSHELGGKYLSEDNRILFERNCGLPASREISSDFYPINKPELLARCVNTESEKSEPFVLPKMDLPNLDRKENIGISVRDTFDSFSDDSEDMTPVMCLSKNYTTKRCDDFTCKSESEHQFQSSKNTNEMNSFSRNTNQKSVSSFLTMCKPKAQSEYRLASNNVLTAENDNDDDEDDDERSNFSPLAALANRHLKQKPIESDFSSKTIPSSIILVPEEQTFSRISDKIVDSREVEQENKSECKKIAEKVKSFASFSVSPAKGKFRSIENNNSNEDGNVSDDSDCSPLAALADKYLRVNDFPEGSSKHLKTNNAISPTLPPNKELKTIESNCFQKERNELKSGESHIEVRTWGVAMETDQENTIMQVRHRMIDQSKIPTYDIVSNDTKDEDDLQNSKHKDYMVVDKPALSLSDLAEYHLTRSASYRVQSDQEIAHKRFHSDTGISRSVPSGFVIPFLLKSDEDYSCSISKTSNSSEDLTDVLGAGKNVFSDESVDGSEDWVIDLSCALRNPELRIPQSISESKVPATVIHVENAEMAPEATEEITPCHLDASGILKMKFSYSKKRCSPFGSVLCRAWGRLSGPYIPRNKNNIGTVARFTFDKPSPDDLILVHLNRKS